MVELPRRVIPAGRANYPGDATHLVGHIMGPTRLGVMLRVAMAVYEPELDRTVVSFVVATP